MHQMYHRTQNKREIIELPFLSDTSDPFVKILLILRLQTRFYFWLLFLHCDILLLRIGRYYLLSSSLHLCLQIIDHFYQICLVRERVSFQRLIEFVRFTLLQ